MEKIEKKFNPESEYMKEGKGGMRFVKGDRPEMLPIPICKGCSDGSHGDHSTIPQKDGRTDCKNVDNIDGKIQQCHCGFGGIYRDEKWQSWDTE